MLGGRILIDTGQNRIVLLLASIPVRNRYPMIVASQESALHGQLPFSRSLLEVLVGIARMCAGDYRSKGLG